MLSVRSIEIVKSTVPHLEEKGSDITSTMYKNMFEEFPQVRSYFNNSHVRTEGEKPSMQASALAGAVLAYAQNIDNLPALTSAVENMVEKHVSFYVLPEHYEVVGKCLLAAMTEVLGPEVVTEEVATAWEESYWFLANLLIGKEKAAREGRKKMEGGWEGYEPFVITKKVKESEKITSFYLKNAQNPERPIINFKPGQYLSVKIPKGEIEGFDDFDLVRNYSLSCGPGENFLRISVKREDEEEEAKMVAGVVSNYLHGNTKQGSTILIGVPCGAFVLDEDSHRKNVVLISGGVGLTPLMSMLEHMLTNDGKTGNKRKIIWIQSVKSPEDHPLKDRIEGLSNEHDNLESFVFYTNSKKKINQKDLKKTKIRMKRLDKGDLEEIIGEEINDFNFYFCGPEGFQKHVNGILVELGANADQIRNEHFAPGPAF